MNIDIKFVRKLKREIKNVYKEVAVDYYENKLIVRIRYSILYLEVDSSNKLHATGESYFCIEENIRKLDLYNFSVGEFDLNKVIILCKIFEKCGRGSKFVNPKSMQTIIHDHVSQSYLLNSCFRSKN